MKNMKKLISILTVFLLLAAVFVGCSNDAKQPETGPTEGETQSVDWPKKTVNIIVPYNAGGSTDVFARILATELEPIFGQSVVVTNVAGGGGAVGFANTLASAADGYTVTVSNGASLTLGGIGNVDFEYDDFDNLARVIVEDLVIGVHKDAPWDTIEEVIDYAKANPGELKYGFAGLGGFTHLASSQFIKTTGIEVDGVGYGGGSEAVAGLLGGFVDIIAQQPAEILAQYEAGEFKALAVMGDNRHPLFGDVPTLTEEGIDLKLYQWRGISGPKGMPEEVKQIWMDAMKKATETAEFKKQVEEVLASDINYLQGADFDKWLVDEANWIYPLIEELGLKE